MGTMNRIGIGLSGHRTVPARQATLAGGIHYLESIPGPHTRLKIRALCERHLRSEVHVKNHVNYWSLHCLKVDGNEK